MGNRELTSVMGVRLSGSASSWCQGHLRQGLSRKQVAMRILWLLQHNVDAQWRAHGRYVGGSCVYEGMFLGEWLNICLIVMWELETRFN